MKAILILGVLGVLLVVAATGCEDAKPDVTVKPPVSTPTPAESGQEVGATAAGDGSWTLELLEGRSLIEDSVVTLRIDGDLLNGVDGCNGYGWRNDDGTPIAGADGVFEIPGFDRTDMLCEEPEGVMDQADLYGSALIEAERYRVEGDRLEIIDGNGTVRLVLKRDAPLAGHPIDLVGTAWRGVAEGDAGIGVRETTIAFLSNQLATGLTACRPYAATFSLSEGSVNFVSKSMLEYDRECAEEERQLEGEYTDFLTWAREYSVYEEGVSSRLAIRSARGKTLIFEPLPPTVENITNADWTLRIVMTLRPGLGVPSRDYVIEGTEVTVKIDEDGISGTSGCNSYGAFAKFEDGLIRVNAQSLHHTARSCVGVEGVMEQEEQFLGLLPGVTRYGVFGDGLFMQSGKDVFLLFQASLEARKREVQTPTGADSPSSTATPTPGPMPTAERNLPERPPKGPGVELGKSYRYSLYVHCGIRDAYFDGRQWMANPMLSDGAGNPPPGWTRDDGRGTMILVRDDLAIFTAVSGRKIAFVPWPSDVEWKPCF